MVVDFWIEISAKWVTQHQDVIQKLSELTGYDEKNIFNREAIEEHNSFFVGNIVWNYQKNVLLEYGTSVLLHKEYSFLFQIIM